MGRIQFLTDTLVMGMVKNQNSKQKLVTKVKANVVAVAANDENNSNNNNEEKEVSEER